MFSHGLAYGPCTGVTTGVLTNVSSYEPMYLTSGPATGTPVAYVFFSQKRLRA